MKRLALIFTFLGFSIFFIAIVGYSQDETRIWKEFVDSLKKGELTADRIRPHYESFKEPLLEYLEMMREKIPGEDFDAQPEVFRVGAEVHYLLTVRYEDREVTFCFSLLTEGEKWYFRHLEAIFIRLDKVTSLPASIFPDLPEERKAWMREETDVTKQVRLFNFLSEEKGKDFAFDWFKDGYGYFLAAKVWVPFVPAQKAFILYLCWEQANLRGNRVTLEKLDENEAVVRMELNYFALYKAAAHLKQQVSFEDYRRIFESIWQDRAEKAGWNLQITYDNEKCLFHFKK